MDHTRIRTLLKMAALVVALPLLLAVGHAQAAVTYSFWLESATYESYPGGPLSTADFLYTKAKISTLQVTLSDPSAGGTFHFSFESGGSPFSSDSPECAGICIVTYTATGMSISSTGDWHMISSFNPPVCTNVICELEASLYGTDGLTGSFFLSSTNDYLRLAGTGYDWTGLWASDGPGSPTSPQILIGHWHIVPLPATLSLLALGLVASSFVRRRRH